MKKKTKGIIFTVLFGGGLLFWATAASMPNVMPPDLDQQISITGTPEDNFPDEQRAQFCSSGPPKSNTYIKEYEIPTKCTQPLAIATDPNGNVWFTQANTGNIAKFDPSSESFTEFENPSWPEGGRSMMWGIDYSPDGTIWYTDEVYDGIWKFSIQDEEYSRSSYPSTGNSLPQRLSVEGSNIIVNDFTGNQITFLDPTQSGSDITYLSLPSPVENSVTGGFDVDSSDNVWYTNWIFQQDGILVKFDHPGYLESTLSEDDVLPALDYFDIFPLPRGLTTPNGLSIGPDDKVWIMDTSSSYFFSFDPESEEFTIYITSLPHESAYGNATGLVKTPISRPYWSTFDDSGRLIFTEQTGNRIGVFDPTEQLLVEYVIPSTNPNWADCELTNTNCGLAQAFDVAVYGKKVWFGEWVENNIGVLDTSIPLPLNVELSTQDITMDRGGVNDLTLTITSLSGNPQNIELTSDNTGLFSDILVTVEYPENLMIGSEPLIVPVTIATSDSILTGTYKVLIGVQNDELNISKYVTVRILPNIDDVQP